MIATDDGKTTKQDDVAAGDTVSFQLTSQIPSTLQDHITYSWDAENKKVVGTVNSTTDEESGDVVTDTYVLTFHDVLNSSLSLNNDSIQVQLVQNVETTGEDGETTVSQETSTLNAQYYKILNSASDGCSFEVSLDLLTLYTDDKIQESDFGTAEIVVTYNATLSSSAVAGTYKNTAWVSFEDTTSEKVVVQVDTYELSVFKYDQSDESALSGATFTLYSDAACETSVATAVSGEDGYATFTGLDAGTYYLKETTAPSGYVASSAALTITLTKESCEANVVSVKMANAAIPSTGGAGTRMYTIIGGCILAAAILIFLLSRRKKKDEE